MGRRGPKKDTQIQKANRGSDHVDKNALEVERTIRDLGTPFDIINEIDIKANQVPFLEAFIDKYLKPASEMGVYNIGVSLALKPLIENYILLEELRREWKRLAPTIFSKDWMRCQKAFLAQEKHYLNLLKECGLTPKEIGNVVQQGVPESTHGNNKSKKDKYG